MVPLGRDVVSPELAPVGPAVAVVLEAGKRAEVQGATEVEFRASDEVVTAAAELVVRYGQSV